MRKPSEAACKADEACTAEHANACLPRSMVAQAKRANNSVQAMAEQLALGVLKGARVLQQYSCSMQQLLKLVCVALVLQACWHQWMLCW
jgi:hypothetical protein